MNIVSGSLFPDEGKVLLSGMDITNMKEYERAKYFGRVFQDPMMGTTAEMSCLENLEIAFRRGKKHSPIRWGFSNKTIQLYYKRLLEEFKLGLEDRLNQKVGVMSGGQRQALTLLMAATDSRLDTLKEFVDMYLNVNSGPIRLKLEKAKLEHNKEDIKKFKQELAEFKKKGKEYASKFYLDEKAKYEKKVEEIKASHLGYEDEEQALLDAYIELSNTYHEFNKDRRILLLDEHTAALDPKTAKKVLELTNKIVREKGLTTLMVTHNMKDALEYGDRLIMFHNGHIIHDFSKEEKDKLKPGDLLALFDKANEALYDKD